MSEQNANQEVAPVSEEDLSKAIDALIEEQFGKAETQPEVKLDELPKDVDVKANGGTDYIKAKEEEEETEEEEDEDEGKEAEKAKKAKSDEKEESKEDEKLEKKAEKCVKKSEEANDSTFEELKKSFDLKNDTLSKSFEELNKSINEKFENVGEIFKGLKYQVDQLSKAVAPRKSLKNVDEIKKSFVEEDVKEDTFNKSEVESAIEELVKSNTIPSTTGTEFEMFGRVSNPQYRNLIAKEIVKNRK